MLSKRLAVSVAVTAVTALAGTLPVLATPTPTPAPSPVQYAVNGSCQREIEMVVWNFNPCIPEGEPLPPEVLRAIEEFRRERECRMSASPNPPPPVEPTSEPVPSEPPLVSASPIEAAPAERERVTPAESEPVPEPSASTPAPVPCPSLPVPDPTTVPTDPVTPVPTGTVPDPDPDPTSSPDPDPDPTTSPQPTGTPTGTPQPTTPVTPPPTSAPATCALESPTSPPVEGAEKDLIACRNPATLPYPNNPPIVFVAAGDSLTSSHWQTDFSLAMCGDGTRKDDRDLVGNHAIFSYAGRYYRNNGQILKYYNFARTGFKTWDMLNAGMGTPDACGNPWGRNASPAALAKDVIDKAKQLGHTAYFVTTGGINDTNWTDVLRQLTICRVFDWFNRQTPPLVTRLSWEATGGGGKALVLPNGGSCTLKVFNPNLLQKDFAYWNGVPPFSGADPEVRAAITRQVKGVVDEILGVRVDKLVWMKYYDMSGAKIDIGNYGYKYLKFLLSPTMQYLLPRLPVEVNVDLIDDAHKVATQQLQTDLNKAIENGLPLATNPKVKFAAADPTKPGQVIGDDDIQKTALGGCPHPNEDGQTKLATILGEALK
ncbi:MAG TPA: hypothetical protein VFC19_05940 [Candidatus Limnocylindrales bacterium]|nr:hypothetical protein [Candidatus Limnocylindrales bacterium]